MLVLTLILWWARSPMRIADGRLRIGISIVSIATLAFPCGNLMPRCVANDSYGGERNRSGIARTENAVDKRTNDAPENRELLREGTLIPPTAGRIVMLGRRWGFVAAAADSETDDDLVTSAQTFRASVVSFESKPRPTRLGAGPTPTKSPDISQTATLTGNPTNAQSAPDTQPGHIIAVENLMLQRIVEAIRADSSDDLWTVSGEILEYFNENRLVIRTAQRANSN